MHKNRAPIPAAFLTAFFAAALIFAACTAPVWGPESQFALGTICHINLYEGGNPGIYSRVFGRLWEIEDIFSFNREHSLLDRVNQNAGIGPLRVSPEFIDVLEAALEMAEKSGGLFDPTIGPLVKLWGIGTEEARVPGEDEIRSALGLINYRDLEINREENTVFLKYPGMALDLGAIAKGYAVDEIVLLLASQGIGRGIINLGGDVYALGERSINRRTMRSTVNEFFRRPPYDDDESYWRIGIQDPLDHLGSHIGILLVKNKSVVSSGTYQRYHEEDGILYHHILSAESGFPVENGLLSVTIVSESGIMADAISTAAFALGWERGLELIASIPGTEGIFIFEDLSVGLTPGIRSYFTLTNDEYRFLR